MAAILAALCWGGLLLQFLIVAQALGPGPGAWRFLGFFTILSNLGIAAISTAIALGHDRGLAAPRARLMGLTAILVVGIVYSLLLRATWAPTGMQKVADVVLHDATPPLFLLLWLIMPHGRLRWSDLPWTLAPPTLYLAYALGRGAIDGWYAYWFLDPNAQAPMEIGVSIAVILTLFTLLGALAIAVDRRIGASRDQATD